LLERGFRAVWPHAGAQVNARRPDDMAAELCACGFEVAISPCWQGTPFSNVLLVARRNGEESASC
jgi:hypothetical protein